MGEGGVYCLLWKVRVAMALSVPGTGKPWSHGRFVNGGEVKCEGRGHPIERREVRGREGVTAAGRRKGRCVSGGSRIPNSRGRTSPHPQTEDLINTHFTLSMVHS